ELVRSPSRQVLSKLGGKGKRVMSQNVADLVTQALTGVVQFGTGTAANIGRPVAGKTGTAEDFVDAWFCGYVPQLVTCVWVGFPHRELSLFNVEGWSAVFGGSLPAEMWQKFMTVATEKMPVRSFPYATDYGQSETGTYYPTSTYSSDTTA